MASIPGLSVPELAPVSVPAPIPVPMSVPMEEIPVIPVESGNLELISFDLKPFTVPEKQRFGKCRLISEFNKLSHIGEGAYGTVYKVKDKKTDEIVALKKLKIGKDTGKLECLPASFLREITLVKSVLHPNIVNCYGMAVGRLFESTYIILEYCPYSLSRVIDNEESKVLLHQAQIKCIVGQLFTGLAYIHHNQILHRDLTPTNILFSPVGILKISDFGFARKASTGDMTPNAVSRWYRAPEILLGSKTYTTAVDIWSAGCVLAELILKRPLFQGDSDNTLIAMIVELLGTPTDMIWPGLTDLPIMKNYELCSQPYNRLSSKFTDHPVELSCVALLHRLFIYYPKNRISAEACLDHPYFQDIPEACDLETLLAMLKKSDEV